MTDLKKHGWLSKFSPQLNLLIGFFGYAVVGCLLLLIPWFHKVSLPAMDVFFTAISAISTTGLITVNTFESYNLGGQILVLLLFQVGGIGYMTLITYILLATTEKITSWHKKVLGAEFEMPADISIRDFLRNLVYFTVIMEVVGALMLWYAFKSDGMATLQALWYGIFHSVSAFCTAGFHLFDNSLIGFQDDSLVALTTAFLSLAGSLGFIVVTDLFYWFRRRIESLTFTSKVILIGILLLLVLATFFFSYSDTYLNNQVPQEYLNSFYLAVTSLTTVGFTTVDISMLDRTTLILVAVLMFIGASPSGTSGGVKITTFAVMVAVLKSRLLGERQTSFLGQNITSRRLFIATSTFILYTFLLFTGVTILIFLQKDIPILDLSFEAASALGTVGLSTGITSQLNDLGKGLIMFLMFTGRVGLIVFGFSLIAKGKREELDPEG